MKDLGYYNGLHYKMEVVKDESESGYVVSFPELPGCVTCADTLEKAILLADDAKSTWIAACLEEGIDIPEPVNDNSYSGQFKLRIPKSLHRSLAERSKEEGISMNQYCLYLLSKNDAACSAGSKSS